MQTIQGVVHLLGWCERAILLVVCWCVACRQFREVLETLHTDMGWLEALVCPHIKQPARSHSSVEVVDE